jgi:hypothetical protein
MPIRPCRRATLALAGALALLAACADRTGDRPNPENPPVTVSAPFQVDPAHRADSRLYGVAFAYDQPVALPRADEDPERKVPAVRMKRVPVVLDVTCTIDNFTLERLPIGQVATIRVYDDRQRPLASFTVATDCDSSVQRTCDFAHDIGSISKTIGHLRMAAPAALDQALRERPAAQITVVGFDAQGRTMLVEQADGCLEKDVGIDRGVRVGSSVVWLGQDRAYAPDQGSLYWRYITTFDHDDTVALPRERIIGDLPEKTRKSPARYLAKTPLVLDLDGTTPLYGREPALAQATMIHVFGPDLRLIATRAVAKDCWLASSSCRLGDDNRAYTLEHLRTALDPAPFAAMGDDDTLWIVAVDGEGRTIMCDLISPLVAVPRAPGAPSAKSSSGAKPPPARRSLGPDPDDLAPESVGVATMDDDGTLRLQLRSEQADGTIAESLLIVAKSDERYAGMLAHLGGLEPGGSRAIPPFPETAVDPDSVAP